MYMYMYTYTGLFHKGIHVHVCFLSLSLSLSLSLCVVPGKMLINGTMRDTLNTVRIAIYNETKTGLQIDYIVQPQWRREYKQQQ